MTDKQPAPVGDCHIVGKAVVPEDFGQLEAEAKRLQELMVSASMECAGKQQEALAEAMEAYLKVSTPSVMLSLLRQNAELKAERDALAIENVALKATVDAVIGVADNSDGIAGWHKNGELASWYELLPELDAEFRDTDTYLNSVRAEGVDEFVKFNELLAKNHPDSMVAKTLEITRSNGAGFAASLRKGGE